MSKQHPPLSAAPSGRYTRHDAAPLSASQTAPQSSSQSAPVTAPSSHSDKPPALVLKDITRRYGDLEVLEGINFAIRPGEIVALLGPSGSGKSSLLHIAGLLEAPSAGHVFIDGKAISRMRDKKRTQIRRDQLGFVYQFHHLLPEFNAITNVMMPLIMANIPRGRARKAARGLLEDLGLGERLKHQPAQLSGGEKQRVAIARALINNPRLLLADEPTGNLDTNTSARVFDAMLAAVRERGTAALIATHDRNLARKMDRIVTINDKKLMLVKIRHADTPTSSL